MTPFDCYKLFLSLKNHFIKSNYDYFKYCGKSNASLTSFNARKDKYFFERSILNLMIINNYNEKQKNKVFKKELNNNGYI